MTNWLQYWQMFTPLEKTRTAGLVVNIYQSEWIIAVRRYLFDTTLHNQGQQTRCLDHLKLQPVCLTTAERQVHGESDKKVLTLMLHRQQQNDQYKHETHLNAVSNSSAFTQYDMCFCYSVLTSRGGASRLLAVRRAETEQKFPSN